MFEQWQGRAFSPSFKSSRNTEFGTPTVYLVAGLARSAVVVLGRLVMWPLMSRERLRTLPRLRKKSRSRLTWSEMKWSFRSREDKCCKEKFIFKTELLSIMKSDHLECCRMQRWQSSCLDADSGEGGGQRTLQFLTKVGAGVWSRVWLNDQVEMLQCDVSSQVISNIQFQTSPNRNLQLLQVWQCPKSPELGKKSNWIYLLTFIKWYH